MRPIGSNSSIRMGAVSLLALLAATPALAQPAVGDEPAADAQAGVAGAPEEQAQAGGLEDIIVTAEKRPESLQKTPIGLSVLTNEDLVNRHVQSLTDLGDGAIPSLRVAPPATANSTSSPVHRPTGPG